MQVFDGDGLVLQGQRVVSFKHGVFHAYVVAVRLVDGKRLFTLTLDAGKAALLDEAGAAEWVRLFRRDSEIKRVAAIFTWQVEDVRA